MRKDKKTYHILLIEDNDGDAMLIEDFIEEQMEAPNLTRVKKYADAGVLLQERTTLFDVILLDLSLPDKSGKDLIVGIIAFCKECPVIVLTGYTDLEFSVQSLSLGVTDYLLKDEINALSLYKSIIYNIERKRSFLELEESEKRYSNLFRLSPQPMWVYAPSTLKFLQVNQAAVDLYGYTEAEFLDMTISRVIEDVQQLDTNEMHDHFKKSGDRIKVQTYNTPVTLNDQPYMLVIAIDVTEKLLMEAQLLNHKIQEFKNLSKAVVNAQEKERAGIGAELHDNVNQLLAASLLYLGHGLMQLKEPGESLIQCKEYISTAMEEIRKLSHVLVGPTHDESIGLIDSIEKLISNMSFVTDIQIHFNHSTYLEEESEVGLKLVIYRIIQEQFSNILKYAGASEIAIGLEKEEGLLVTTISDNGKGFDTSARKKGIGLKNIKSRAALYNGILDLQSSPGNGCNMKVTFNNM